MAADDIETLARAYERWLLVANVGILGGSVVFAVTAILYIDGIVAGLLLAVVGFGMLVRFVDAEGSHELVTSKSPEAVREEFLGPDPPTMALVRGRAESVRRTGDGIEYTLSVLTRTRVLGYEVSEDDGDIVCDIRRDGDGYSQQRLSIRRDGEVTVVAVSVAVPSLRLTQYLVAKLQDHYYKRALAVRGSEYRPAGESTAAAG